METEEIKKEFEKIRERLKNLEERNSQNEKEPKENKPRIKNANYKGLSGGIRFLIEKEFLNPPKSVKEIQEELKREGYHYPYESVDKLLRVDFHKKNKILNRIKEEKVWKYVIRK